MNILLQLGLGLLPGTAGAVFFLIKRRAIGFKKILFTLLLISGCGTSLFFGVSHSLKEIPATHTLSQDELIEFAYALYSEGAYTQVEEVIDQYSRQYGYDDTCRLLYARMALSDADYERAAVLYGYLCSNTALVNAGDTEVVFASNKASTDINDLISIEYLTQSGVQLEDYGYTQESYGTISNVISQSDTDAHRSIQNSIDDNYPSSALVSEYAHLVAVLSGLPADTSVSDDAAFISDYKDTFKEIEKNCPEYLTLECVQKARIQTYVLSGDYSGFVRSLDGSSSYHELMAASELYMADLVSRSSFPDEYKQLNSSEVQLVKQALSKIYQKEAKGLNKQERRQLKSRVNALSTQLSDTALLTIKDELVAASGSAETADTSKILLQAAKIDNYFGNETSAEAYIQSALNTSQNSDDRDYSSAMLELISIIDSTEVSDEIKNVPQYVDTALAHSLTVNVEPYIAAQAALNATDKSDKEQLDFSQTAINYVSRVKSAIFIGSIDSSEFEKITARIQIDSDIKDIDALKAALKVYDCNNKITDYDLKKIDYSASNIILLCDVSGSMSESIDNLKAAVTTFINDKNSDENLAVATFSDSIEDFKDFNTSDDELISFAQSMYAVGGTDMFSSVVYCINRFTANKNENNVLILMTDGQDNYSHSNDEIYETIGALASQNNVTIYTMGLGDDVDTSYLNTIAGSGNGQFVYVSDSTSLTTFYDLLHSQMYSQYELTYNAIDTMTSSNRTLETALPAQGLTAVKTYSLGGEAESPDNALTISGLSITGLKPSSIYKGLQATSVKLKGSSFDKNDNISVRLSGKASYTLNPIYEDAETYALNIPSNIATGTYDVEVIINGKKKIISNGFSVLDKGKEITTTFGKYVFTSAQRTVDPADTIILSGNVTLNGWLHFNGSIAIRGDLVNDGSISVYDGSGSYVQFDPAKATGLGKLMADLGIDIGIPKLYNFTLYNDQSSKFDESDYLVDDIAAGTLIIYEIIKFDNINIRLYPNHIGLYNSKGTALFPGVKKLLNIEDEDDSLFSFDFDNISVSSKNVGIKCEFKLQNDSDKKTFSTIKGYFFGNPVHFNGHLSLALDTYKNEYSIGGMVRFAMLAKESGLGAEIGIKQATVKNSKTGKEKTKLVADSVELKIEPGVPLKLPTAIPIDLTKFSASVSDIKDCVENNDFKKISLTGKFTLACGNLKSEFPKIASFIGINTILEMPDTTLSLKISPFKIGAEASLTFLEKITLAKAAVEVGTFDYTNALLELDSEQVSGLSASLSKGFQWDSENKRASVEITGTGELDAHSKFIGTIFDGVSKFDINWWLFNYESKEEMTSAIGFHTTRRGDVEFILKGRYQDSKGKIKGFFYFIDKNGLHNGKHGTLN